MLQLLSNRQEATVVTLKSRYSNMYIPSDFIHASCNWVEAFPPHRAFDLGQPCTFHVMAKDVVNEQVDTALEPPDADHLYSAKVRNTRNLTLMFTEGLNF